MEAAIRESGAPCGRDANEVLVQQDAGMTAGAAPCLAAGEGRQAVPLASLCDRVLAQDISDGGLAKARQLAASRGTALETLCCDRADSEPEAASVDLVVAIWMHLPAALQTITHHRAERPCGPEVT